MNYWLMKSEPDVFGIDDLKDTDTEHWDGIRNYQARNMIRDQMKIGDLAFFYHSSCDIPGIVGIMEVVREGHPDSTAFDQTETYFDPKSDPENPRWYMVDVKFIRKFKRVISLQELKKIPELSDFQLVKRGNRLSILPVNKDYWDMIVSLEENIPMAAMS